MADYLETTVAACRAGLDYTTRQMALLALLSRTTAAQRYSGLVVELGIRKPAATRAADRLQAAGLLKRVPAKDDARQVDLALTAAGRKLVDRARAGFPGTKTRETA